MSSKAGPRVVRTWAQSQAAKPRLCTGSDSALCFALECELAYIYIYIYIIYIYTYIFALYTVTRHNGRVLHSGKLYQIIHTMWFFSAMLHAAT